MSHDTASVHEGELKPKAFFIHPGVHRRLKLHVINHGGTMQASVEEAVSEWLDKREAELQAEEK